MRCSHKMPSAIFEGMGGGGGGYGHSPWPISGSQDVITSIIRPKHVILSLKPQPMM